MNLLNVLKHIEKEFPQVKWELCTNAKGYAYKIKCKPEKRLVIEIHPEPIDMGVKVNYSFHDESEKNGRFREFGVSNAKDLAGIDKLLIEYLAKADPLYDGRQLTIFDLMGGVRRKHANS